MTDDSVIEEAAKAIFAEEQCDRRQKRDAESIDENWNGRLSDRDKTEYRNLSRAAWVVFEKALAPTDDERWLNNLSYAATALEASADNGDRYCARLIREHLTAVGFRRSGVPEPQGEPSDAQVIAATRKWMSSYRISEPRDRMRAALRAAAEAKP